MSAEARGRGPRHNARMLSKPEVLDTVRRLSDLPLWLVGGVAADFHVDRWTRDHGDIDLVAFAEDRRPLEAALRSRGFALERDRGWITNWTRRVSLAFEERVDAVTGNIVVRDARDGVIPGIYPEPPGNLDPSRWRELEGVRFRVASAESDWVYTMGFRAFRPGAPVRERTGLRLLESIISDVDVLRPWIGGRLPLTRAGRVEARPFSGDADLVAMQRLVSVLWPEGRHPGGLAWSVTTDQLDELVLYEDGDELVGFVGHEDGVPLIAAVPEALDHIAATAGIERVQGTGRLMRRGATADVPPAPNGHSVRSVREDEVDARVQVHRESWNPHDLPWHRDHKPSYAKDARSGHSREIYDRVRRAWMYDPFLDLVAVASDGTLAGSCIVWFDPRTATAEIEPLGVVPAHRRRGIAGALCHEATRRVAELGGRELFISQQPNESYPAPAGAYARAGFEVVDHGHIYRRAD